MAVHPVWPQPSEGPIVVGTDGSANAAAATRWAADLAATIGSELLVIHALSLMEQLSDGSHVPADEFRVEIEALLHHEWSAPAVDAGASFRALLEDGPPVLVLPRLAEREGATLIVAGLRGTGGGLQDMIGSTCHGLLNRSPVPVVAIPPVRDVGLWKT